MKTIMKLAIIIFVAMLAQSCSDQKAENDWTRDGLQGKILSFSELAYEAEDRFGQIEKGKRSSDLWYVDVQCKYDENGNEIEVNGYNNGNGILSDKSTYKYDEKGNKIEENKYESDGSLSGKWTYKYDEKGNKIEMNSYKLDGSLEYKKTYKYVYDKQGNWIKRIDFYDGIAKFIVEREYEYYK